MKRAGLFILAAAISFFTQSVQAGWTPAKRLTWTSGYSYSPAIAVDSFGHLHLVWHEYPPGNEELYYMKSTDGGATWTPAKRLTWTSGNSWNPAIVVDASGKLYLVWRDSTPGFDYEIYFKKSTDGGGTWTPSKRLTWTSGLSSYPNIAIDSVGNLHLVWTDNAPGNDELYYKKSTDEGASWSKMKRITWTPGYSNYPAIVAEPSNYIHTIWEDDSPGNNQLYYKKSTDEGASWSKMKRITWTSNHSFWPVAAVDSSGNLHVIWGEKLSDGVELYHKKSTDSGATWTTNKRITWTSGRCYYPAITVDSSDHLYVVWYDDGPGNAEIFYKKTTDGGATWSASQRITWNSGHSYDPAIAVDLSSNIHVLWTDGTPGNDEIYYKKGN